VELKSQQITAENVVHDRAADDLRIGPMSQLPRQDAARIHYR
jgi:hypothetical protein